MMRDIFGQTECSNVLVTDPTPALTYTTYMYMYALLDTILIDKAYCYITTLVVHYRTRRCWTIFAQTRLKCG